MRRCVLAVICFAVACGGEEAPEPEVEAPEPGVEAPVELDNASVQFVGIEDGATVTGPLVDGKVSVHVGMGVEGAQVRPAGELEAGTGHHHIIVDGPATPFGTAVPADDRHIHFGGGQTEADVMLTPGEHTLTLQFADGMHRSYGPDLSTRISITVAEETAEEGEGEGEGEPVTEE